MFSEDARFFHHLLVEKDIELSIRMFKKNLTVKLFPDAYVYHKRRTNFKSFIRQVFRFGAARINIFYRHRTELKITHLFPSAFLLFLIAGLASAFVSTFLFKIFLGIIGMYYGAIFLISTMKEKSM